MTDSMSCMGCLVSPKFIFPQPFVDISYLDIPKKSSGLTDAEMEVLCLLKDAWGKFVDLGFHLDHDIKEFNYAIHLAQQKLALRVARRIDPDVWNQPKEENVA